MLKIRCSAIGKIMTNARSKSEVLSKTCKSYLQELAIEEMYGIKKEFSSRYTDKGVEVETVEIECHSDRSRTGRVRPGKGDRPPADARSEAEGQRRGRPRSCGAEKQVSARTARRRRGSCG